MEDFKEKKYHEELEDKKTEVKESEEEVEVEESEEEVEVEETEEEVEVEETEEEVEAEESEEEVEAEESEEEENKVELNKNIKKTPSVKINKKVISIVISLLISIVSFAFINSIVNKNKVNRNIKKEETTTSKPNRLGYDITIEANNSNLDNINDEKNRTTEIEERVNYGNVSYGNTTNSNVSHGNTTKRTDLNDEDEEIKNGVYNNLANEQVNKEIDNIIGRNIQLEEYYTRLVDSELAGRESEIEYSNYGKEKISSEEEKSKNKKGKEYNSSEITDPLYLNEIKSGSIIPAIMLTGINSELGGNMVGIVRENVYDTVNGNNILIPRGTRIIGKYDNVIGFGQERLLIVWDRLIFPNGKSLLLDSFQGTDLTGNIGIKGKVDNHTIKLLQSVVLSSILGGATALVKGDDKEDLTVAEAIAQAGGERIVDIGEMLAERVLNIRPTIKIKPGARFNILVTADLILDPYNQ